MSSVDAGIYRKKKYINDINKTFSNANHTIPYTLLSGSFA